MINLVMFQPTIIEMGYKTQHYVDDLNQQSDEICYFPYASGLLWNYASREPLVKANVNLSRIFFEPYSSNKFIDEIKQSGITPDICAFSTYIWNAENQILNARHVKEEWPECFIVFGGPDVNADYLSHTFIDSIVIGEGEIAFTNLLLDLINNKEISRIARDGGARVEDLSVTPSPYLTNLFADMINSYPKIYWNAVIESDRGCPYSCSFCTWGASNKSKIKKHDVEIIKDEIQWIKDKNIKVRFHIANSNMGIFVDRDTEIINSLTNNASKSVTMTSTTSKTNINMAHQLYKSATNDRFSISLQSLNNQTLKAIKRKNLSLDEHMALCKEMDYKARIELIVGLPLETYDSFVDGINKILAYGVDTFIIARSLMLINNSPMASNNERSKYKLKITNDQYHIVISTSTMSTNDMIKINVLMRGLRLFYQFSPIVQEIIHECFVDHNIPHLTFIDMLNQRIIKKYPLLAKGLLSDTDPTAKNYMCNYKYISNDVKDLFEKSLREIRLEACDLFFNLTNCNVSESIVDNEPNWEEFNTYLDNRVIRKDYL